MNGNRILVLEDDDETLACMSRVLRAEGYEVYERDLLLEHISEVQYLAPSLIIVDVFQRAKPIGWELIQTLKAHAVTAPIPLILYTAGCLTPEQLDQTRLHRIPVVYQPFDLNELLHLVESLTQKSAASTYAWGRTMGAQECLLQEMPVAFHATIIVVATDRSLITLLKMALTVHYSCNVIGLNFANSIVQTMKLLKLLKPDYVVIHLHPFEQQALTLIDQLHALEGLARLPILLTHSLGDCNGVPHKPHLTLLRAPFTLEALYAAVNTCFDQTT